jgi:CrcB protein
MGARFPYGTFFINISACVIIGFSMGFLGKRADLSPAWRFLVPVGFIGAYSTFSTFEWETYTNLQSGAYWVAILYVTLSFVFGLVAVWSGVAVAKSL